MKIGIIFDPENVGSSVRASYLIGLKNRNCCKRKHRSILIDAVWYGFGQSQKVQREYNRFGNVVCARHGAQKAYLTIWTQHKHTISTRCDNSSHLTHNEHLSSIEFQTALDGLHRLCIAFAHFDKCGEINAKCTLLHWNFTLNVSVSISKLIASTGHSIYEQWPEISEENKRDFVIVSINHINHYITFDWNV